MPATRPTRYRNGPTRRPAHKAAVPHKAAAPVAAVPPPYVFKPSTIDPGLFGVQPDEFGSYSFTRSGLLEYVMSVVRMVADDLRPPAPEPPTAVVTVKNIERDPRTNMITRIVERAAVEA